MSFFPHIYKAAKSSLIVGLSIISYAQAQDKGIVIRTPANTFHKLVLVLAGEFTMGSEEGSSDARPVHTVHIDSYYIDQYEVNNDQYQAFVQATGRKQPRYAKDRDLNDPQQPVSGVTWLDAQDYCAWAGLRLPTEAEWEKAARGTDGRAYPWGPDLPDGTQGNFADMNTEFTWRDTLIDDGHEFPAPVGSYASGIGPYNTFDQGGNLWEWVKDWYAEGYYARSPERNPQGPEEGTLRVIRGGSWYSGAPALSTTFRNRHDPTHGTLYIGFRCAQELGKLPSTILPSKSWGQIKDEVSEPDN